MHLIPFVIRANAHYDLFFNIGEGVREIKATYDTFGNRFKNYDDFKQFYYNAIINLSCTILKKENTTYIELQKIFHHF
jgi:hypothetical protein